MTVRAEMVCGNISGVSTTESILKATWNGQIIADSNSTVEVEGNQYFPLESVKQEYIESSSHTSVCPWKGTAHYYSLKVDGKTNQDAAWYYPNPSAAAQEIKGRLAFWKGVQVKP